MLESGKAFVWQVIVVQTRESEGRHAKVSLKAHERTGRYKIDSDVLKIAQCSQYSPYSEYQVYWEYGDYCMYWRGTALRGTPINRSGWLNRIQTLQGNCLGADG